MNVYVNDGKLLKNSNCNVMWSLIRDSRNNSKLMPKQTFQKAVCEITNEDSEYFSGIDKFVIKKKKNVK